MDKSDLREEAKRLREGLEGDAASADAAAALFFDTFQPKPDTIIASYYPMGNEFNTLPLMEKLVEARAQVALPVMEKDSKILKFAPWNKHTRMDMGAYNVPQPVVDGGAAYVTPDIVIVPLLAFDRKGHRLGYGGGYYDATLAHLRGEGKVIAAGMAYGEQAVLFPLPSEAHDEILDYVITPVQVHRFSID